ncbi:carbohydrate kinase family protein [Candidatus Bathyarchaeota archaeon]|nr:carbohydrate kinase family protein [Candidatus Bathyarchaeota archaeon]
MIDVIGFGALNLDKIIYVDKIPKPDEEGYVRSICYCPGGSAANTVVGLARLGLKTGYIGKVGNDEEGKILLEDLRNEKVDTSLVKACTGRSGVAYIFVDEKGIRASIVDPGVNDTIGVEDIDLDYVKKSKFLHLTSFISKLSTKSFLTQKKIVEEVPNVEISFDPGQLYAEKGMGELESIIKRSKVILPSKREIELLTGYEYKTGCKILLKKGVEIVAVKLGEKGCYVTNGKEEYHIPAETVEVVDTTGAGDAFCAGFLYGLVKNKDIYECGKLGNFVASRCITKSGAREGLPTLSDLYRIKTFSSNIQP